MKDSKTFRPGPAQALPGVAAGPLARAKQEHRAGRFVVAEGLYAQAIKTVPGDAVEARRCLGILYAQTKRPREAIGQFAAALQLAPENLALVGDLAMAYLNGGRPEEAAGAYRQALIRHPDSAELHGGLGNVLAQSGKAAEAVASYRRAIAIAPGSRDVQINLGVMLQRLGDHGEAAAAFRRALALDPRSFEAQFNLGVACAAQGDFAAAIAAYRAALKINPKSAAVQVNLGKMLEGQGLLDEAIPCYRQAIRIDPALAEAHDNLGSALAVQGRLDEAVAAHRTAASLDPGAAAVQVNLGLALEQQKKGEEAIECYRRAVALDPSHMAAYNNLGSALCDLRRIDEAIVVYREALRIDPNVAQVYVNLGAALCDKERQDEAVQCFERAASLDPSFPAPHLARAMALRGPGLVDESFASYRRHAELRYGTGTPRRRRLADIPPQKTRHDREQLRYFVEHGIVDGTDPEIRAALSDDAALAAFYDRFYHIDGGEKLTGPAINPNNAVTRIEAEWATSAPQLIVVDDLLTPEALAAMRRFCWGSTIWRQPYPGGYLGAFPQAEFASPLMAQIAEELRLGFRGVFGDNMLTYCWGFKYDSRLKGINIHADIAEVNVNFWITPDEANLDPESGGLVVWDVPAPLDWDFESYNMKEGVIRDFIAQTNAKSVTVPYRANRAVIFDSDLFHQTDRIVFKDGYLNRRVNVTLLYGLRENDTSIQLAAKRLAKFEY